MAKGRSNTHISVKRRPNLTQHLTPEAQARAEARLTKQQERARESELALAAYHAENRAVEEKTARLRAARLAKEAQERTRAEEADSAAPKPVETSPREAADAFIAKRRTLKPRAVKAAPKSRAKKKLTAH
jgi:hypothetical protein